MSYDGIVTGAIAYELNDRLKGGRIDKIYQPESDELIFHIHATRETHRLYISVNGGSARLHLIDWDHPNPQTPSSFCMLLRKHLQGGRIREIHQIESERIVCFSIDHIDELGFSQGKELLVELMGKHSNIIAIDHASGKILDSIKRIGLDVNRYRQLLPGLPYVSPPSQGKIPFWNLKLPDLEPILSQNGVSYSKALVNGIQGIGPVISEELCLRAFLDPDAQCSLAGSASLLKSLTDMTSLIQKKEWSPVVYQNSFGPVDFHVFPLKTLLGSFEEHQFADPSKAIDYYYVSKLETNRIRQKSSDLLKTIQTGLSKLYLKKQRLLEDLLKAERAEKDRLFGELLTANLHLIASGLDRVVLENYYDGSQESIPLDVRLSPVENAQKYFRSYQKSKIALREKTLQLNETEDSIDYLESVLSFLEQADGLDAIEGIRQELIEGGFVKPRKNPYRLSKSKPTLLSMTTPDGFRILIGRNNKENDQLTFKTADKKDLWFHTKDLPGSHVILIRDGKQPTESAILAAASFAAYYSKGRQSENVPVDFTEVRFVKKPAGAKPGKVIFTDQKTVYVNPNNSLPSE